MRPANNVLQIQSGSRDFTQLLLETLLVLNFYSTRTCTPTPLTLSSALPDSALLYASLIYATFLFTTLLNFDCYTFLLRSSLLYLY